MLIYYSCLLYLWVGIKYYFGCCRDGSTKEKKISLDPEVARKKRVKRESRKIGGICISRLYPTQQHNGAVHVKYISLHSNHDLSLDQAKFLLLPKDIKNSTAIKLAQGIPNDRILDGKAHIIVTLLSIDIIKCFRHQTRPR